ncbi:tetratricopeptide repeat protein [Candidatus Magnetaquicoccus inordinatus]|uniref:tetratricopeptide repeat protein n=1 Tax=Candidatus Magnetaquicoccus inordinatus TaxID=2496818 RepID=UPI00102B0610|nr:tetratricopeptide repeat protein [Candidatus Magnetaquicoccus inordinatus]
MLSFNHPGVVRGLALSLLWLLFFTVNEAAAFSTVLKVSREEKGNREVLSFNIPPGAGRPRLELLTPETLRLVVPGLLALPANALDTAQSHLISSFKVEGLQSDEMGLDITIGLKKINLAFRDSLGSSDPVLGTPYRLEIDTPIAPSSVKENRILESRAVAGRDGTLLVISYTGSAQVESAVDLGSHLLRLHWRGALLDPGWRPAKPEGLAERLLAYPFPEQVEMELLLEPGVSDVRFHQSNEAGLYIIAIANKSQLGRQADVEELIRQRKEQLSGGEVRPLNRLDPAFIARPERTVVLSGKLVDEVYYLKSAQAAAKDHRYARARGFLRRLLTVFPDTPNRQFVEFYLWDLAYQMRWKPGWLLAGLGNLLARYPNTIYYPRYRLLQLHLLNRAGLYEEAEHILWDPNLPKDNVRVWVERGHTALGLARSNQGDPTNWKAAKEYLHKVVELTGDKGDASAEAHYLLVRAAQNPNNEGASATKLLDELQPEHLAFIANRPDWLMSIADIYYENRIYNRAFKFYSQVLTNYPTLTRLTPWATLRAAESSWQMGRSAEPGSLEQRDRYFDARNLYNTLREKYPKSDAAVWGQVFQLRMEDGNDVATRLKRINSVAKHIRLPDALSELLIAKAELLGEDGRFEEALVTLNRIIASTTEIKMVSRATKLKRDYLLTGMQRDLSADRPEHAILLAELNGEELRNNSHLTPVRIHLAEALLRIGMPEKVTTLLDGLATPSASSLKRLSSAFAAGIWPEVMAPPEMGEAVRAMSEAHPMVGAGAPPVDETFSAEEAAASAARQAAPIPDSEGNQSANELVPVEEARVRLDEAARLLDLKEWEAILRLLEKLPDNLLSPNGQEKRLRLMARAEEGRERYPFAVQYLEDLLAGRKVADGNDYYWYASVLQQWKGDAKALPAFLRVSEEATDKEVQALAHMRVGDIMQREGNYPGARDHFREAARLTPDSALATVSQENASQLEMAMEVAK